MVVATQNCECKNMKYFILRIHTATWKDFICSYHNSSCFNFEPRMVGNPQKPTGKPFTFLSLAANAVKEEMQLPIK